MFGSSKASTMAIVWPVPSPTIVPKVSEFIPYAVRICAGVMPKGVLEPPKGIAPPVEGFELEVEPPSGPMAVGS